MSSKSTQSPTRQIAKVIERTQGDASLRQQLVKDPRKTLEANGIKVPGNFDITVWENTRDTMHLVVPEERLAPEQRQQTISSTSTTGQIGLWIVTQIQDNSSIKSDLLSNTKSVLKKRGVTVPASLDLQIHVNTPKVKNIVIPFTAGDNDELSDFELEAVAGGKGGGQIAGDVLTGLSIAADFL